MAYVLLDSGTGNSDSYTAKWGKSIPATLIAYGLAGAETVDIQISHDKGTTWQDLYVDGAQVQLTTTNVATTIYGPGTYRGTTAATGITLVADNGEITR